MAKDWEDSFAKKPRRTTLNIALSALGIIAVIGAASTVLGIVTAPLRTASGIIENISRPDNVIQNYEWFKTQYQDVKSIENKIVVTKSLMETFLQSAGPRDTWKFEDRQEYNRLNGLLLGLQGQRSDMVAKYNARTQMANRDLFRTSDLPATIE